MNLHVSKTIFLQFYRFKICCSSSSYFSTRKEYFKRQSFFSNFSIFARIYRFHEEGFLNDLICTSGFILVLSSHMHCIESRCVSQCLNAMNTIEENISYFFILLIVMQASYDLHAGRKSQCSVPIFKAIIKQVRF